MKTVTVLSLLFLLVSPAFSQLTKEDLRTILREEITASEKRTREYIDLKVETINTRIDATNIRIDDINRKFNWIWVMIIALIGLIAAAIAAPQIIVARRENRENGQQQLQTQIEQIHERLNALENTPS